MFRAGPKAVAVVLALNLGLLLGCAELDKLLGGPNANKPAKVKAAASPTPTGTPGTLAVFTNNLGKDVGKAGNSVVASAEKVQTNIDKALEDITPQKERALGQSVSFHLIAQNGGLVRDERLMAYVNEVGNLVAQQGERRKSTRSGKPRTQARRFFFGVLASDELNAYAAPGGYIFVTRGLVQNLSSEAELAWVLGHEIVHVDNEDGLTVLKAQAVTQGASSAVGFEDFGFFSKTVTKCVDIVANGSFSGGDELNADVVGLKLATAAGYDPHGATRALTLLGTKVRKQRLLPSGHKSPTARLEILAKQIAAAKPGKIGEVRYDTEAIQRVEASLVALAPVVPVAPAATPTAAEPAPTAAPTAEPAAEPAAEATPQ